MKATPFLLTGLLLLPACAAPGTSNLYSGNLPAPAPSLADDLPADTLFYMEIADVQKMREDIAGSDLGLMYYDEEMQTFIAGGLELLDQGWADLRMMMAEQGMPAELLDWDTLESFAMGLAVRAAPGTESPFDQPPQIYALAELGLGEGTGEAAYAMMRGMMPVAGEADEPMTMYFGDFRLDVSRDGDVIRAEMVMGDRGEGVLSADQEFRRSRLQVEADGAAMFGYMDFETMADTMREGIIGEAPQFQALIDRLYDDVCGQVNGLAFATGWGDDGTYTKFKLDLEDDSQEEGSIFRVEPFDRELLAYIPSDATAFTIANSDSAAGAEFMMNLLDDAAATEPMPGMQLGSLLQMQAPEVYDWLYGSNRGQVEAAMRSFGDRSFSYTVANGFQAESLSFVEVKDPAALNSMLEQLMPRVKEMMDQAEDMPIQLKMKRVSLTVTEGDVTSKVAGPAYYYIDFDLSGMGLPPELSGLIQFQPTLGVSDDGWMVFSMSRNSVRRVLQQGVPMPDESILANAEAADFLARVPADAFSVTWGDPRPTIDALAGMALGFAPMAIGPLQQEMGLPISLDDLPSADLFTRHLRPSESVSYVTNGDLISVAHGSFGLADMFTLIGAGVGVGGPVAAFLGMSEEAMMEGVEFDAYDTESF